MKTSQKFQRIALLSSLLCFIFALTGCEKSDPAITMNYCSESFGSAYSSGKSEAAAENQADYDRGKAVGSGFGYDDGKAAGLSAAYQKGYNSPQGYSLGYNQQKPVGYTAGQADPVASMSGASNGASDGATIGFNDGKNAGYADGSVDGQYDGATDGYNDGYDDGYFAGTFAAAGDPGYYCSGSWKPGSVNPNGANARRSDEESANQCKTLGYQVTRNAQAFYNQGYADGRAPNYQQGYDDYKNDPASIQDGTIAGFNAGKVQGYSDGYHQGYLATYTAYYNPTYTSSYNSSYTNAYNSYYATGRADGYNDQYNPNYDFGYDDGFSDGVYDYCFFNSANKTTRAGVKSNSGVRYRNSPNYLKKHALTNRAGFHGKSAKGLDLIKKARLELGKMKWNVNAASRGLPSIRIPEGKKYLPRLNK